MAGGLTNDLPLLLQTFLNRFQLIMDTSLNAYQSDSTSLTRLMDEMERHLFSLGQQALHQQISWERGFGHHITPSVMVEATRKRKRQASDSTGH